MSRIQIPKTLEEWNEVGREYLPGLLGIEFTLVSYEVMRSRMAVRRPVLAWNGFLHGGSVVALADSTCGYGTVASLPDDATGFTTIELKSNFLGTAREGYVECVARPLHRGRTTQVWDAEVRAERGSEGSAGGSAGGSNRAIAHFRCTQLILRA